jgi:Protein of unknown function (DUF2591)
MKIKTNELVRRNLDWAVAKSVNAKGWEPFYPDPFEGYGRGPVYTPLPYSSDWSCGGPLVDEEDIDLCRDRAVEADARFIARLSRAKIHPTRNANWYAAQNGPTKLIAAMRCHVASRLGDEVDVPDGLM